MTTVRESDVLALDPEDVKDDPSWADLLDPTRFPAPGELFIEDQDIAY